MTLTEFREWATQFERTCGDHECMNTAHWVGDWRLAEITMKQTVGFDDIEVTIDRAFASHDVTF